MKTTILKLLLFLFTTTIFAQAGQLDRTFNARIGDGANATVTSVAVQPDGKILMVGDFINYAYTSTNRIARLNTDGSIDTSFNLGIGANNSIVSIVLQPDGKILIIGEFTSYNGISINRIARLNPDGTLDTTFNPGTGSNFYTSLAIQTDGKIVIAGFFASYNGIARKNIARLNADGSLDTTFDPGIGPSTTVQGVAIDSNGKIVIVGEFTSFSGIPRNCIARLNTDGTLDTTFNPGIGADNSVFSIAIQSDEKILIGGFFSTYNNAPRSGIARLNPDGTLDTTFNPGTGANSTVQSIITQNGKIIIGGDFTNYNDTSRNHIARINEDGTLDFTFTPGTAANERIKDLAALADGKIIIAGNFTSYNDTAVGRLAQLNADGTFSTTFLNPGGFGSGASHSLDTMALQSDGNILISGQFLSSYNGIPKSRLVRLNNDGTLNTTFNPGTGPSSTVFSIVAQTDGKIVIGGRFNFYNGISRSRIARLNSDGSLDTTFNPGTGANDEIRSMALQTDGKILIVGLFTSYNGISRNRIARLNTDGTIDTSFNIGTGTNNDIFSVAVQTDDKILIAGRFTLYNTISKNFLCRLNTDGTLDNTFNAGGSGASSFSVLVITLQSDGKILIAGQFSAYNGITRRNMARLNGDGTLDTTFVPETMIFTNTGTNPIATPSSMTVQTNGKILIGGDISFYGGVPVLNIVRLNNNGTLDATFNGGTGFVNNLGITSSVDNIIIQPDGNILIAGRFRSYNGNPVGSVARILIDNGTLATTEFYTKSFTVYPNPSNGIFTIQIENPLENATILVAELNGKIVYAAKLENVNNNSLNLNHLQNGVYILNISNGNNRFSKKLIKQ